MPAYLDSKTLGIGKLISDRKAFTVPDHQRAYSWTKDEVKEFLDDVIDAHQRGAEDYFLGLIVLVKESDHAWQILDGQQRLATTTMVYSAIRQWLVTAGETDDATKIDESYIAERELGEKHLEPKLTLNVADRHIFRELVVNRCNDDLVQTRLRPLGRFSSQRKLAEALSFCRERIGELAKAAGTETQTQARRLYALANYLCDKVTVVCLDVPSTSNAYTIFEALNDRGLDLSVLDLVKNHMFGKAGDSLQEVQADWGRMVAQLGDRRADDFLKAYWTSRFGRVQRGRLFEDWRRKYSTEGEIVKLAKELAGAAEKYAALDIPDHDTWASYGKECREVVRILALLGNQQVRPVVLAALERFDSARMEMLLKHLITLTVRYQLVGKGRTGALEIACARAAHRIFTKELTSPLKVWKEFESIAPGDTDFRHDFAEYSEVDARKARYILIQLESVARDEAGHREPVASDENWTLEHVFPKRTSSAWRQEQKTNPELRQSIHKLGNQCLLSYEGNKELGSKGFAEKRKLYDKSSLQLTKEVGKARKWTTRTISKQQLWLARLAVKAWPLPRGS